VATVVREHLRLFHTADELFGLVLDVRSYPQFISQITALRVLEESEGDLTAEARVRYKFVAESFTSRVRSDAGALSIDVSFVSGPFRTLINNWRFHPLSDGSCLVDFYIEAEFKIGMLQMLLEANKARAGHVLIKRFSDEAGRRFGPSGNPELDLTEEIDALIQQA